MVSKFFETHKHIVIVGILGALSIILVDKYLDRAAKDADARLHSAQETLALQEDANNKLAAQNQQAQQQFQAMETALNAQNARLSGEILQLSQSLVARQKQDDSLTLPDLAIRWQTLLSLPQNSITSTVNGQLSVSSEAGRATVSNLESLPVLKQQLSDETTVADNRAKSLDTSQSLVVDLNKQVSGLQLEITDGQKTCDARVTAAKKGRWKWFKMGAVSGFLGGLIVGHKIP